VNDDEDLELQALQRQLDDAFQTTRPRAGFEDALWARMQARRPMWQRLREFFSGLVESVREVPAVPAAAVAVVLVLAIGVGILSFSGFHFGGGASTTAGSAPQAQSGGAQYNAVPGGFGRLPTPALQSIAALDTGPKAVSPSQQSATELYLGPATLTWTGQLNIQISSAPVYRYKEPSTPDKDRFATGVGASPQNVIASGALRQYPGDGFGLAVTGSSSFPLAEPLFAIASSGSKPPPPGASPADAAMAFLTAHNLVPTWPYAVVVDQSTDFTRLNYLRQFNVPPYGLVYTVNATGDRHGLVVDVKNGQWQQAYGPLPLNLDSAEYPIISAEQAVRNALTAPPSESTGFSPAPTVNLTSAELVYALAYAGDHSFYEPAYLFSGTFTHNGTTYVKRVLVPAIAS
jgi:hypothetical protein